MQTQKRSKDDQDWLDSLTYEQKLKMLSLDQCAELFSRLYEHYKGAEEQFLHRQRVTKILFWCIILGWSIMMSLTIWATCARVWAWLLNCLTA